MFFPHGKTLYVFGIWQISDERSVAFAFLAPTGVLRCKDAGLEVRLEVPPLTDRAYGKERTERINSLHPDAVHSGGELDVISVEVRPCVHLGHAVNDLAERDSSPIVAHRNLARAVVDRNVDLLSEPPDVLVYAIVNSLLQEDVHAVVISASIPDVPDVHPRPFPDMGKRIKRPDVLFSVALLHADISAVPERRFTVPVIPLGIDIF